jgi:hypothetical protein
MSTTSTSKHAFTAGPASVFICDDGGQWSGWPLSVNSVDDDDKTIVRPGGFYPYKWDAAVSQREAVANANLIAEAFTVAHETGLTPRQLADDLRATKGILAAIRERVCHLEVERDELCKQRAELLAVLQMAECKLVAARSALSDAGISLPLTDAIIAVQDAMIKAGG